ncbi:unnamed protein product [Adineta ricciae]|uniref:G-protein coupled receptors family 1 profile domain-containing protein n=1 Tax=Adineta ricciae TaxID=249248 RepID=A0A815JRN6_ADIRI|nr:unnamed protein product [Adineta ricciae]
MNDRQIIILLVYIKIILLGFTSIGSILYSLPFIFIRRFHTPLHFLSLNVSITIFVCASFWAIYYFMSTFHADILWTEKSCLVILYLQTLVVCQFIYALCIVSLNRLCAIRYHRSVVFRKKKWAIMCIVVQWLFAAIIPLPQFGSSLEHCFISGLELNYQIYVLFIVGVLPGIFLAISNSLIFYSVHRSTRRIQAENQGGDAVGLVSSQRDTRLLKHMLFMYVIFFCGWIPIYIIGVINWDGNGISYIVFHALLILPALSLVIDLIDLFLYSHELRTYLFKKTRN